MKKIIKSKLFQLSLSLFLAACIILTGTYAWSDFLDRRTVFTPSVAPPEVMLVDFSLQGGEVYVVNNTGQDVFVRIKLSQYLAIGGKPVIAGMLKEDTSTWADNSPEEISKYYRLVNSRAVIPMSLWKQQGSPIGDYWVADIDGWYYYARRLASGETTRTLLQEVTKNSFKELVDDDYGLNTALQAVPKEELYDLLALDAQSFTSDGMLLLKYLNGEMVTFV